MKAFISVLVSVLVLFVSTCRAVPLSRTSCDTCKTDLNNGKVCKPGNCTSIMRDGKCSFICECPMGTSGSTCNDKSGNMPNVPAIKEVVQVKVNPLAALDFAVFGPQAVDQNLSQNTGSADSATTTTTTTSTTSTTTTSKPIKTRNGAEASGTIGTANSQGSSAGASSGQSAGGSSGSAHGSQSSSGSSSPASSSATASGAAGSARGQVASAVPAGSQSPAEVPKSGSSSGSAEAPTPGSFRTRGVASVSDALSLVHFQTPTQQQGSASGTASTDMLTKLQQLYSGANAGSSAGATAQQSSGSFQQSGTSSGGILVPSSKPPVSSASGSSSSSNK